MVAASVTGPARRRFRRPRPAPRRPTRRLPFGDTVRASMRSVPMAPPQPSRHRPSLSHLRPLVASAILPHRSRTTSFRSVGFVWQRRVRSAASGSFSSVGFVQQRRVRSAASGSFSSVGFVQQRRVRSAASGSFSSVGFGFQIEDYYPKIMAASPVGCQLLFADVQKARHPNRAQRFPTPNAPELMLIALYVLLFCPRRQLSKMRP